MPFNHLLSGTRCMMAVIAATAFPPVRGTLFCVSPFRSSSSGSDFYRPTDTIEKRHCDFYIAVPFL
nr:MAG TPA: hypothetical protein [Caudoviricetes sp.]